MILKYLVPMFSCSRTIPNIRILCENCFLKYVSLLFVMFYILATVRLIAFHISATSGFTIPHNVLLQMPRLNMGELEKSCEENGFNSASLKEICLNLHVFSERLCFFHKNQTQK